MAEIRLQVDDEIMNRLKRCLHLKSNTDVVQQALTILSWAVEERMENRLILSTNIEGRDVAKLAMPSLMRVKPDHQHV